MWLYDFSTRFECGYTSSPLVSSVVFLQKMRQLKFHEKKLLRKVNFYDWSNTEGLTGPAKQNNIREANVKLQSFRVYFVQFSTRFECILLSYPPLSTRYE